ncbi:MAG: DUF364 domain-containing protein, partial [Bacteroidales bacterium]
STFGKPVNTDPLLLTNPDLNHIDHRMLVTAYANANINYMQEKLGSGDIFDQISFAAKKNTVMVGYFPPLVAKFQKEGIKVSAFDQQKEYDDLIPLSELKSYLNEADCVIMTSTTLINSSFAGLLSQLKSGTEVFLLGPSTTLSPRIRNEYHLSGQFGMIFNPYDFEVLEIISKGLGTQSFSKKGKKVSL